MAIRHDLKHYYQPTNKSCSQSALAMVFSHFGKTMAPEDIIANVPVVKNDKGEDVGTLNQELATWCLSQGFAVHMYTADFQITDLSWRDMPREELLEHMERAKTHRDVPALGREMSERYMQSYVDFVKAGGTLHVEWYMTPALIDTLLQDGPLIVAVCYEVLYGTGRMKGNGELRQSEPNDTEGKLATHSVVVYGKDDAGTYLIADPWREPGMHEIEPALLVAAMDASQIECDNLVIQLHRA